MWIFWLALPLLVFIGPLEHPEFRSLALTGFTLTGWLLALIFFVLVLRQKTRRRAIPRLLFLSFVLALWFGFGFHWGVRLHLLVYQSDYQAKLAAISQAQPDKTHADICGEKCRIVSATPLLVYFHFSHGFLNWVDLVFDDSNQLHTKSRDELREFDLYLYRVEPLPSSSWNIGYFGD